MPLELLFAVAPPPLAPDDDDEDAVLPPKLSPDAWGSPPVCREHATAATMPIPSPPMAVAWRATR
jgi:hypothetical protein